MQRLLLIICLASFLPGRHHAQTGPTSFLRQYTTDNGLPSNGIKGLQWDEATGFLWLATEAGIVRFNGSDFRVYNYANLPFIESERMLFLIRNNAGRIYAGDLSGNILQLGENKPRLQYKATGKANPFYDHYYLLPVSDTFFSTFTGKLVQNRFSIVNHRVIPVSDTACLVQAGDSLFYQTAGMPFPKPFHWQNEKVITVFRIGKKIFIIDQKNRMYAFQHYPAPPVPVVIPGLPVLAGALQKRDARIFWETGMDNPVLIENGKAFLLENEDGQIRTRFLFGNIPDGVLVRWVQYSKKYNLLFLGTDSRGLIVIGQHLVTPKKRTGASSLQRNAYYSQFELPDGSVLTNEGDVIGETGTGKISLPIQGVFSYHIAVTGDSALWYSQYNRNLRQACLFRYNLETGARHMYPKILGESRVTGSGSQIYLANFSGIGILEADSIRYLHKYPDAVKDVMVYDFREISPGQLVYATCGGLYIYHTATGKFDTLFSQQNVCIRAVWKYGDYIFFGTYGSGFYIWKNGRVRAMPPDKHRYLLYTHCFVPDDSGFCWISTNRGLFKASLAELTSAFDKNSDAVYYHYFGKKDGLEMTELNGGCTPCALRLKNGVLSFPSMDGLLWVDPGQANPMMPEGDIYIDEILVNNELLDPPHFSSESLPYKTGEIVFRLAYSAWGNKENIYLSYQLNDTISWQPVAAGDGSEIRFSHLPPGDYRLRIRKLNGFGVNNYSFRDVTFTITTPWHQQWWFYLLCTLGLFGLISLYLRFRTRQYMIRQHKLEKQVEEKTQELQEQNRILEKNNSINTRLISIISHDIVTPLKFLTVAGKNLLQKRKLMNEELQDETIGEMARTSQELQLLSTNILNWIKYQNENRRLVKENFDLHEMVEQVFGILLSLARQKGLNVVNRVEPGMEVYQYYEPLKILVYNLLTNAIQFTESGKITVAANKENGFITVSVQDEGTGMTPEQVQRLMDDVVVITSANVDNKRGHGLGYLIIKDLVKTMGARLHIESRKEEGTKVSVSMPATRNGQG